MNRREFIKSIGIGVIAAPIVAKAASEPKPDEMTKRLRELGRAFKDLDRYYDGPAHFMSISQTKVQEAQDRLLREQIMEYCPPDHDDFEGDE